MDIKADGTKESSCTILSLAAYGFSGRPATTKELALSLALLSSAKEAKGAPSHLFFTVKLFENGNHRTRELEYWQKALLLCE